MSKSYYMLHEAYLSVYDEKESIDVEEAYIPMTGKKLRRVMTKVRDLSSRSQLMRSDPNYRRLAKEKGHSDTDINKKAGELEDRGDKIIARIGEHDPEKAQEREASNRRTINVRATQVNIPRLKEEVDIYDLVLDYLLDEGYCESVENAETMMAYMSEDWVESIIDERTNNGSRRTHSRTR